MTRSMYSIILLTGFFTTCVAILSTWIFLTRPEWAFPVVEYQPTEIVPIVAESEKDDVFIASFEQTAFTGDAESGFVWTGQVMVVNAQRIPAKEAILTIQIVHSDGVELRQFITNEQGVAAFSVFLPEGSYRIEVLDITGESYRYNRRLDAIRSLSGTATDPDTMNL